MRGIAIHINTTALGHNFLSSLNYQEGGTCYCECNQLHLQLDSKDKPLPGEETYNAVDAISMYHD